MESIKSNSGILTAQVPNLQKIVLWKLIQLEVIQQDGCLLRIYLRNDTPKGSWQTHDYSIASYPRSRHLTSRYPSEGVLEGNVSHIMK